MITSQTKTCQVQKVKTLLRAAVGTGHHEHGFKACTVYGRSGSMSRNDAAVQNLSALNSLVKSFRCFHLTHQHKNGLSIQ